MIRQYSIAAAVTVLLGFSSIETADARIEKSVIKIGILNDMSGPYADLGGPGSVVAAQMAVEDAGGAINGVRVERISGDHQTRPTSDPRLQDGGLTSTGWLGSLTCLFPR